MYLFKINIPQNKIEEVVEKLNIEGFYDLFYDLPFETFQTGNGYGFHVKTDEKLELTVYGEEHLEPNSYAAKIAEVLNVSTKEITIETWEEIQNSSFEAIDLNNGWSIVYDDGEQSKRERNTLLLDPQGAFGTGLHETTQDCLRLILDRDFSNERVLDLGAGSGVLSVAAALKGAKEVVAIDIQPINREVVLHSSLNQVSSVHVKQQDLLHTKIEWDRDYTWVFINIGADETESIIRKNNLVGKANYFLLSGIVEWNEKNLNDFFLDNDYMLLKRLQSNEWVTLIWALPQ